MNLVELKQRAVLAARAAGEVFSAFIKDRGVTAPTLHEVLRGSDFTVTTLLRLSRIAREVSGDSAVEICRDGYPAVVLHADDYAALKRVKAGDTTIPDLSAAQLNEARNRPPAPIQPN